MGRICTGILPSGTTDLVDKGVFREVETRTFNQTEITNSIIILANTPKFPDQVVWTIDGFGDQFVNIDFNIQFNNQLHIINSELANAVDLGRAYTIEYDR